MKEANIKSEELEELILTKDTTLWRNLIDLQQDIKNFKEM